MSGLQDRSTQAAKHVASLLRDALAVQRVGLMMEGYGIDHAHIKLVPMHGIPAGPWQPIASQPEDRRYYETYPGFIASHGGPPMPEAQLSEWHALILAARQRG